MISFNDEKLALSTVNSYKAQGEIGAHLVDTWFEVLQNVEDGIKDDSEIDSKYLIPKLWDREIDRVRHENDPDVVFEILFLTLQYWAHSEKLEGALTPMESTLVAYIIQNKLSAIQEAESQE